MEKILRFTIIVLISGLVGFYIGVSKVEFQWNNYKPQFNVSSKEPPVPRKNVDFSMFWTVWDKLEASYYDKQALNPQKLLNGAILGMVESLEDPYTVFLPPVQNASFKQGLAGKFEGIGAELGMKGKQIIVVAPLDGSPAQKAGIKAGDAIVKVDNQSTAGWTLSQAVEKIRGPKGTQVTLWVVHKSQEEPKNIKIVRDTITVKSVYGWVKKAKDIEKINLDKKYHSKTNEVIMYIRLSQFGDNTNQEWLTLINSLDLESKRYVRLKGVILDLRNNPGGYLTDATFVASEFLKSAVVVVQEKGNGEKTSFSVSRPGLLTDVPIIVLINKGSASASEIVAGALRDYGRAVLVGEGSFGKGTIQQAEDLGEGAGLHVTIAKWLTPKGTWVHSKGLTPDVSVSLDLKDPSHDTQLEKAVEELLK